MSEFALKSSPHLRTPALVTSNLNICPWLWRSILTRSAPRHLRVEQHPYTHSRLSSRTWLVSRWLLSYDLYTLCSSAAPAASCRNACMISPRCQPTIRTWTVLWMKFVCVRARACACVRACVRACVCAVPPTSLTLASRLGLSTGPAGRRLYFPLAAGMRSLIVYSEVWLSIRIDLDSWTWHWASLGSPVALTAADTRASKRSTNRRYC